MEGGLQRLQRELGVTPPRVSTLGPRGLHRQNKHGVTTQQGRRQARQARRRGGVLAARGTADGGAGALLRI